MASPRPPIPLQKCLRGISRPGLVPPPPLRRDPAGTRSFRSTPPSFKKPVRAPSTRRAQTLGRGVNISNDGLLNEPRLSSDRVAEAHQTLLRDGMRLFLEAQQNGILPLSLAPHVFFRVARDVIAGSYYETPNDAAIRSISKDVDMVYKIGYVIAWFHSAVWEWLIAGCARAGSRLAVVTAAARFLSTKHSLSYPNAAVLRQAQDLALVEEDPRAIIIHAMILSRQERNAEAIAVLRPILHNHIYPTKNMPYFDNDILVRGHVLPPWKVLLHSAQAIGDHDSVKEARRIAALEYHDPEELVMYASELLQETGDLAQYEQLMCLAATGGNAEACLRLANFYFLAHLNLHPVTLEDLNANSATDQDKGKVAAAEERLHQVLAKLLESNNTQPLVRAVLSAFWYRLFPFFRKADYRGLAFHWYDLASVRGHPKASLLLARFVEQRGDREEALELLDDAAKDGSFAGAVGKLRQAWLRDESGPKVPDSWFNV
ncbi:hypothetical protein PHISP_07425 [Aspergillus sp. HF37]|nr:hypothetical protein PHISP_07425 [Aspergillus sp. HF37]